jgi:ligand-binding SRPBCC domain-containing protein
VRVFELSRSLTLDRPLEEVFAFFADPLNLEAITPPWLHFGIQHLTDRSIRAGTEIQYRLRIRGVPVRWRSRISSWEPPHRFVDEQLRGPYRQWVHTHTFEERDGRTLVGDHVAYAPLGGWLADRLLVRRDLERIFDHRHERLQTLLAPPAARAGSASDVPLT